MDSCRRDHPFDERNTRWRRDEHEGEETWDDEEQMWRKPPLPERYLNALNAAEQATRIAIAACSAAREEQGNG